MANARQKAEKREKRTFLAFMKPSLEDLKNIEYLIIKMNISQDKYKKNHFIGIGGIGVSALARYFLAQGAQVSGSDATKSEITRDLEKLGAKISIGHKAENIKILSSCDDGRLIYSAAVQKGNPELKEARRRGIKCQTYAQALGELTKKYFTIAVSGTHGKSTTTAMISLILEAAGLDPTVIVGTKLTEWNNSNCRIGKSKYLVIEADEYAASFLNYWPKIIVLTNIEEEHLDFYGNLEHIVRAFREYVGHLPKDGWLVVNEEDRNVQKIVQNSKLKTQNFNPKLKVKNLKLKVRGFHNLSNAMAAITVARLLKIPDKISIKTLNNFTGTWRRMEYKGKVNGAKIYDDYGHHPTEIKATLSGAKELLNKNYKLKNRNQLWCVFQPHQYQRTYKLFNEFIGVFGEADKVIFLPIYSVPGREKEAIKKKVSSKVLVEAMIKNNQKTGIIDQEALYLNSFNKAKEFLRENLKNGDICIIMGAGDVYKLTEKLRPES